MYEVRGFIVFIIFSNINIFFINNNLDIKLFILSF